MSAYEGSAMQEANERRRVERQRRRDQIHRENPSLSWADVNILEAREWEAKRPPPPCCACTTGKREIVRVGDRLGPCECACHGGAA